MPWQAAPGFRGSGCLTVVLSSTRRASCVEGGNDVAELTNAARRNGPAAFGRTVTVTTLRGWAGIVRRAQPNETTGELPPGSFWQFLPFSDRSTRARGLEVAVRAT